MSKVYQSGGAPGGCGFQRGNEYAGNAGPQSGAQGPEVD